MRADTIDEKDERLTDTHYASEAAARDLPAPKPKAKKAKVAKNPSAIKTYRLRIRIDSALSKEELTKHIENVLPGAAVRKIREVE